MQGKAGMNPNEALAEYGTKAAAARAMGISRSTFRRRYDTLNGTAPSSALAVRDADMEPEHRLTFPSLPDVRESLDRLIERRTEHYERLRDHREAATWQQIKVRDREPIGLVFVGDPHIDSDGCAWPQLLSDTALMRETDGVYGVNIGDTTNNWIGRLTRLFGEQETSQSSARQLAEWFLVKSGIRWAAVIIGNHDEWNEGGEIISRMVKNATVEIPVHDWAAKLEFVFPNNATCRVNLAHDFKGRSIYSTTHGPLREAIWFQDGADIAVAGHIHFGGLQQVELPGGHNPWLVRVRGYKEMDSFALHKGFHEGRRFHSAMAVIDPTAPKHERVLMFASVKQGCDVLNAMRSGSTKQLPAPKRKRKSRQAKVAKHARAKGARSQRRVKRKRAA